MSLPEFTVLIDGECPLCRHEARVMRRLDRGLGRLGLVDIADPSFDAGSYGTSIEAVMGQIHGVTADGRLVTGVEVFRRAYRAVGLGWVVSWTGLPVIRGVVDLVYRVFARYRLRLTGRGGACVGGRCAVQSSASGATK